MTKAGTGAPSASRKRSSLYDLPPAEAKEVKSTPGSLDQALDALERDHAFLLRGDVFTRDVIETWLDYKRKYDMSFFS